MTLGQRISHYRKNLGISQEELGARLDVSRQAVSKWETDAAVPDMENLLSLAREFNISVAELTATPQQPQAPETQIHIPKKRHSSLVIVIIILCLLLALTLPLTVVLVSRIVFDKQVDENGIVHADPGTPFALICTDKNGNGDYLTLGTQVGAFPYGTSFIPTEPEEVYDTDFSSMTHHKVDCGAITVEYYRVEENGTVTETITSLSTIVPGVRTPRGITVESTKEQLITAYGDELVYHFKEEDGYSLVQHDEYYLYYTPETFSNHIKFFLQHGKVVGIQVAYLEDVGAEELAPDRIYSFPVVNGEVDFTMRQDPEYEYKGDTWAIYYAFNQLATNNNLSAEEIYAYRRDIFANLPNADWEEYATFSTTEYPDEGYFALMDYLLDLEPYSSAEILWMQMGCMAKGLDGAYTDMYAAVLCNAFFSDPITFASMLSASGMTAQLADTAIGLTAYDADCHPTEAVTAINTLHAAIEDSSTFTSEQIGWAKLLLLNLNTPVNEHYTLPKSPAEMTE